LKNVFLVIYYLAETWGAASPRLGTTELGVLSSLFARDLFGLVR